jgi:hypothetical protein
MTSAQKILIIVAVVIVLSVGGLALMDDAPPQARYEPGSHAARSLFRVAAQYAGLPTEWADSEALHELLRRESGGWVGRPNYTFGELAATKNAARWPTEVWARLRAGEVWTKSTATGLGQLLTSNAKAKYPHGLDGIGQPLDEAVGMLRYIEDRYGSPETALKMHGKTGYYVHTSTGAKKIKSFQEGY